jgi:hypothetical protein
VSAKREEHAVDFDTSKPLVLFDDLDGPFGNLLMGIMPRCAQAWREWHRERGTYRSGHEAPGEPADSERRWKEIVEEMLSGDYKHALAIVDREFTVIQQVKVYQPVSALAVSDRFDEERTGA